MYLTEKNRSLSLKEPLDSLKKMLCYLERAVGHASPEIEIHLCFVVAQGHIAHNAERHKRHLIDMTGLSNRAAFHIYGHGFGEV